MGRVMRIRFCGEATSVCSNITPGDSIDPIIAAERNIVNQFLQDPRKAVQKLTMFLIWFLIDTQNKQSSSKAN